MQRAANDGAAGLGAIAALEREVARSTERRGEVPLARCSRAGESYQPEELFWTLYTTASHYGYPELEPRAS